MWPFKHQPRGPTRVLYPLLGSLLFNIYLLPLYDALDTLDINIHVCRWSPILVTFISVGNISFLYCAHMIVVYHYLKAGMYSPVAQMFLFEINKKKKNFSCSTAAEAQNTISNVLALLENWFTYYILKIYPDKTQLLDINGKVLNPQLLRVIRTPLKLISQTISGILI